MKKMMLLSKMFCCCMLLPGMGWSVEDFSGKELHVVRGNGEYPPHEMTVDGKLVGIHIDLVTAVAKELKLKLSIESYPWARAVQRIKQGRSDAITFLGKNSKREAFTYYFEGNITSYTKMVLFIAKDREKEIRYTGDLHALKPYVIAIQRGYSYGEQFDNANYLTKDAFETKLQIAQLLLHKRIDIGIVNLSELKYGLKNAGVLDKLVILQPPVTRSPVYIGFSKAKAPEALAKQFSHTMAAFKKKPAYQNILKKYGLD